jgi:hypothetical protein
MMSQAVECNWEDLSRSIPCFLTMTLIPFTCSIANGIMFGLIAASFFYVTTGEMEKGNICTIHCSTCFYLFMFSKRFYENNNAFLYIYNFHFYLFDTKKSIFHVILISLCIDIRNFFRRNRYESIIGGYMPISEPNLELPDKFRASDFTDKCIPV